MNRAARCPYRVHTYSLVARDAVTGQLGVAVQSKYFAVGAVVPWAEPGVGAVATQAEVEPSYGPRGLALMRAGRAAPEALAELLAGDPNPELRQVAMVDAHGNAAAHTGERCCQAAGHVTGPGFSAQANLAAGEGVWMAMAKAYERAEGDLAERLMGALEAAQAEGGDVRGMQSAALLVVSGEVASPGGGRVVDLRVDDSPRPLAELRRLLAKARSYRHWQAAFDLLRGGSLDEGAKARVAREVGCAIDLCPPTGDDPERLFRYAFELALAGLADASLPYFKRAFRANPRLVELFPRLVPIGLLPDDPALIRRILEEARS